MPVKKQECCCGHTPKRAMLMGIALFIAGILKYMGYDWSIVLMAIGVLLVLKGIILKLKK